MNVFWDDAEYLSGVPCYTYAGRVEFIDGDSLIDGYFYRIANGYPFLGTPGPGNTICPPYFIDTILYRHAKIREDTSSRKVYIYDENSEPHDQLLYNFSISAGDTFQSSYATLGGYLVVDTVFDTLLLNGEIRKIFCFDPSCSINYIEGIGGWQGLYWPIVLGLGFGWELLCVKENYIPIWGYKCTYPVVGKPDNFFVMFNISPNPANDLVTFRFSNDLRNNDTLIDIYDLFGNQVMKRVLTKGQTETTLDIRTLAPGLYCYSVTQKMNRKTRKLVVVR